MIAIYYYSYYFMLHSRATVTINNTINSTYHEACLHCSNKFYNICKHLKHKTFEALVTYPCFTYDFLMLSNSLKIR
jgi:hypothetical protein